MAKILVVEDSPLNMKLTCLLLHNAGHAVLCAVDAEAGLLLARAERPDMILMDIQLPGMDGWEATRILKNDAATAGIPVIALTAMAMNEDEGKSQSAGCDAYISKPLRYEALYAAVDALLARGCPPVVGDEPGGAAAVVSTGGKAVDLSVLENLIGKDPLLIGEFLAEFQASAGIIVQQLKTACAVGQVDQAARQAHKLRSVAYSIGALALGGLCAELEIAGKARSADTLTALLPLLEREAAAVDAFLSDVMTRSGVAAQDVRAQARS